MGEDEAGTVAGRRGAWRPAFQAILVVRVGQAALEWTELMKMQP